MDKNEYETDVVVNAAGGFAREIIWWQESIPFTRKTWDPSYWADC